MFKHHTLLTFAGIFLSVQAAAASKTYTVMLAKVNAQKTVFGDAGDKTMFICDKKVLVNERPEGEDEAYWQFGGEKKKIQRVEISCLEGKPLGTSFELRLEAMNKKDNFHIGTLKATLVREEDEVRLAFEQNKANGIYRARRWTRVDGEKLWATRVFPGSDQPGNYILFFKIEEKE